MTSFKKIGISILFLLLSSAYVFANKNIDYLQLVYAAEEAIINTDYKNALAKYQKAFKTKGEKIFSEDIFNALKCAILIKDKNTSLQLLDQLGQTGVGAQFLQINFENDFKNEATLFQNICLQSDQIAADRKNVNKALLEQLDSLVTRDQYYHTLWHERVKSTSFRVHEMDADPVFQDMTLQDKKISKALKEIIENGNTLSEFQLGPAIAKNPLSYTPSFEIIIMHNFQGTETTADTLFQPILLQQIKNGDIKPVFYANLSDANHNKNKLDYGNAAVYINLLSDKIYVNKYVYGASDMNTQLNSNRSKIHLYPLEKQLERVVFSAFNKDKFNINSAYYSKNGVPNLAYDIEYNKQ